MCDKIQEGNDKYIESRNTVQKTGCIEYHDAVEICLKEHGKDWRSCQAQVSELGKCVRLAKDKLKT